MSRYAICFLVVGVALGGCVTKSTFEALQGQHNELKKSLETTNGTLMQRNRKIVNLQAEITRLQKELDRLNAEKAAMLKDKTELQSSVEEMQGALAELERRKAEVEARLGEFRSLLDRFKPLVDAGRLRVKIVDGRMVVELASDILFQSGSAALGKEGRATIEEVTGLLASIPDRSFQVEGHTDDVPIRSERFPSNWELAASRAVTVVKTMVAAGMPQGRISAASLGETRPAMPNDSKENRAANRRIEIVVVPDLSKLPGFEQLKKLAEPSGL